MEQFVLYLVIKQIINSINSKFKVSFNDMSITSEYVIGVYIKGSPTSSYRSLSTGRLYNYGARIQVVGQGGRDKAGLMELLDLMSKLRDIVIRAPNTTYSDIDGVSMVDGDIVLGNEGSSLNLTLAQTRLLGEVNFDGVSEQDLPKYSLNLQTFYFIKED